MNPTHQAASDARHTTLPAFRHPRSCAHPQRMRVPFFVADSHAPVVHGSLHVGAPVVRRHRPRGGWLSLTGFKELLSALHARTATGLIQLFWCAAAVATFYGWWLLFFIAGDSK